MNKTTPQPEVTQPTEARHPIQIAARRSGLSVDVIRVWERRYSAVSPARLKGGRRVYSDADIRRLSLLQQVTSAGRRIGDVAIMDNATLQSLIEEDRQGAGLLDNKTTGLSVAEQYVADAMQATRLLNPEKLGQVIASASVELPLNLLLEQMLTPLLRLIGERCKAGEIRVGQEHMASAVIRHYLVGFLNNASEEMNTLVFTCPSGHYHELGVLMAAVTAESEGWHSLYLGADLPVAEIAAATLQAKAKAVALGLQCTMDESILMNDLNRLRDTLPEDVTLIISGAAALPLKTQLLKLPARVPENLAQFREMLSTL